MSEPNDIIRTYQAATREVHKLWTEHVDKPGYDKKAWQALSNAVDKLGRDAATLAGHPRDRALVEQPCRDRNCQRELGHAGLHMSRTWNAANRQEIIDEWGNVPTNPSP